MISDKQFNLKYNRERKQSQFWIDPSGKIHKLKGDLTKDIISVHYQIAIGLYPDLEYPDDYLMDNGWVMVGSTVYNTPIIHKKPTKAQIKKLNLLNLYTRLCFRYKDTYPNYDKNQALCE